MPFRILIFAIFGLLAACSDRPGPEVLRPTGMTVPEAKLVTVYIATSRQQQQGDDLSFTAMHSTTTNYLRVTVSVPPTHKLGEIEWPDETPNPATDFVTVAHNPLTRAEFEREVAARRHGKRPEVGVFVHGYNTNFPEALYRLAQMSADSNIDGVPILFAWPSVGSVTGYVADKDAVTYSRDQLVELLAMLSRKQTQGPINLVGHSMGAWLSTEAVRQLRLTGQDQVIARLKIILAAPDIDVDVFRAQLKAIGKLNPPMTILVSNDDGALGISQFISGKRPRLGRMDVNEPRVQSVARAEGVQIIDISDMQSLDRFRHDRFASLAALYPRSEEGEQGGPIGDLRQTGAFVFNTVGATLSTPFTLTGRALAGE